VATDRPAARGPLGKRLVGAFASLCDAKAPRPIPRRPTQPQFAGEAR
jgi:hypothetical protein